MFKKIPLFAVILCVLFAVLITFQVTYLAVYKGYRAELAEGTADDTADKAFMEKLTDKLSQLDATYREIYFGELDEEDIINWAALGYVYGTGDAYGEYMDPETYASFSRDSGGEGVGIGILVSYNDQYGLMEIINITPDSPASETDLCVGDLVCTVDGEDALELGYYGTLMKMQGDAGTVASFTVLRGDQKIDYSITRREYQSVSVLSHMNEDAKTGIVRVLDFNDSTFAQFVEALETLKSEGATQFVFDVRNNSGGLLTSISQVLDYLLPEGPIIRVVDKEGNESVMYSDANEFDAPMVVLANARTASAAELFTAALRDYGKASIVGMTTYGKGSMQTIVPYDDGSALRITYRHYLPPYSEGYDGVGITPDIELEMPEDKQNVSLYVLSDAEDDQLQRALAVLNESPAE